MPLFPKTRLQHLGFWVDLGSPRRGRGGDGREGGSPQELRVCPQYLVTEMPSSVSRFAAGPRGGTRGRLQPQTHTHPSLRHPPSLLNHGGNGGRPGETAQSDETSAPASHFPRPRTPVSVTPTTKDAGAWSHLPLGGNSHGVRLRRELELVHAFRLTPRVAAAK